MEFSAPSTKDQITCYDKQQDKLRRKGQFDKMCYKSIIENILLLDNLSSSIPECIWSVTENSPLIILILVIGICSNEKANLVE